ncbi:MAG: metalloregulator ArsR/SmtB family transcription factor [Pseudomonadota bacterium]
MEILRDILSVESAAQAFAALGSDHRLAVLQALVAAGPVGLATGALAQRVSMPSSTLSHHLRTLRDAGLVTQERQGRSLIVRAEFDTVDRLSQFLLLNCCADASAATSSSDQVPS